jgi:hypothetical protein
MLSILLTTVLTAWGVGGCERIDPPPASRSKMT